MKKKILVATAVLLIMTGCKDVKLDNGESAVVTFTEGGISSQELYSKMKESYGASTIMDMIDTYLLDIKYDETDEEKSYIDEQVKSLESTAESYNVDLETIASYYYGVSTKDALKEVFRLKYRKDKWAKDYGKTQVTDKQVDEYYESEIFGDIEASQILITVDVEDDATDEEKEEAKTKAKETAEEVIKKLKDGEDFAELAKKYSKDTTTAENGGSLGKVNTDSANAEVIDALRTMKDGTYSTTPIESENGYYIVFRTSQDEKPEKTDDLIDEIKTKVGEEMAEEDGYSLKAIKALREENEMTFEDTDLESDFNKLVKQEESSTSSSED